MATTTTTQIASAKTEFFDKVLLVRALPFLSYDKFGQRKPLPKGNSKTIKFRRYTTLSTATSALSEGTQPTAVQLEKTDITADIAQYGNVVEITDMVDQTNVESVLTEANELLGENAGESLDEIYRDVLVAGTTVQYSNGAARTAVNEILTGEMLDKSIRTLKRNNSVMHTEMIKAGTGIGTSPIRPAFWAIVHPDVEYTLEKISGFKPTIEYASQGPVMEGEIGSYKNIRFLSTTKGKIWTDGGGAVAGAVRSTTGTNCDVYGILIFAKNAYGITELRGEGLKNYFKDFGSSGTDDTLNQKASAGWKATTVAKILNDNFMLRLEVAAAA